MEYLKTYKIIKQYQMLKTTTQTLRHLQCNCVYKVMTLHATK